ncbi:unnamed protein product [Heligmosomoides polygyrus]|uniref:Endo/exonuclease/phosphatase domain-containing protein n=1 Tax=Heligmosomoides polygyrus TaxID=6339 RepID=A0A183FY24_HELPZ|nr:unnamed protein product [Heligmosomoides polygyrus]
MKEKEAAVISRVRLPTVTTVDETWKKATDAIRQAARLELGTTKPGRRKVDKQAWLWTDDVKAKVRDRGTSKDVIIVVGDLNGHVGAAKDGYSCHGGFGYGSRNADGEPILEYAESYSLTIANTAFRKRDFHLISYYSGSSKSQINFVLVKDRDRSIVTDAKIVPYETVAPQHRPLVCTFKITPPRVHQVGAARIRWWRMKEKEGAVISRVRLPTVTTVNESWKRATDAIRQAARLELGTTKPRRRKVDKQAWLWTDDVNAKVREKKSLYHVIRHGMMLQPRKHSLFLLDTAATTRASERPGCYQEEEKQPGGTRTGKPKETSKGVNWDQEGGGLKTGGQTSKGGPAIKSSKKKRVRGNLASGFGWRANDIWKLLGMRMVAEEQPEGRSTAQHKPMALMDGPETMRMMNGREW